MSRRESVKGRWVVKLNRTRFLFFLWQLDRIRFRATRFANSYFLPKDQKKRRIRRCKFLNGLDTFIYLFFFFLSGERRKISHKSVKSIVSFLSNWSTLLENYIKARPKQKNWFDNCKLFTVSFLSLSKSINILEFLNKKKRKRVLWK